MKRRLLAVAALLLAAPLRAAEYDIDAMHSTVGFKVKHMVVSKVSGRFQKFTGGFSYDPKDASSWKAKAVIDAASIDTAVAKRDEHLRSAEFFDVQKFPTLEFAGSKATMGKDGKARLEGQLTMHGVTKPVTLDLEVGGVVKDPQGHEHAGFSAATRISRKDFGLTWNKLLEAGGAMIGDEVDISIEIEGIRKGS